MIKDDLKQILNDFFNEMKYKDYENLRKLDEIIEAIDYLKEPNGSEKVKLPKYVASYLTWMRNVNQFNEPYIILNSIMSGMCAGTDVEKEGSQTAHWLEGNPDNIKILVDACTNGYEIEKEPKYRVKLPGLAGNNGQQYISKSADGKLFACARRDYLQQEFTNDELKSAPKWVQRLEFEEVKDD